MKYPLRIVYQSHGRKIAIADASGKIILAGDDHPDVIRLVKRVVRQSNFFRRWFGRPKPYSREDWMWERNTWRP